MTYRIIVALAVWLAAPEVNLVFSTWLSFIVILLLLLGFVAWISYMAWSVRRIKLDVKSMITWDEFHVEFEKCKREIVKELRGDGP